MAAAALTGHAGNIICMRRRGWAGRPLEPLHTEARAQANPVRPSRSQDRKITVTLGFVADAIAADGRMHRESQQSAASLLTVQSEPTTLLDLAMSVSANAQAGLTIWAALLDHSGNAEIEGVLRMCHGVQGRDCSQCTEERRFELYCPAGRTVNHFIRVAIDDNGEDYAVLQLTITNTGA